MQYERRKAQRITVSLAARWEGVSDRSEATVTSLSYTGCFLLSGGKVHPKELIRIEIYLTDDQDEEPVYALGEVVEHAYEIGFAVQFNFLETDDQARLAKFILDFLSA